MAPDLISYVELPKRHQAYKIDCDGLQGLNELPTVYSHSQGIRLGIQEIGIRILEDKGRVYILLQLVVSCNHHFNIFCYGRCLEAWQKGANTLRSIHLYLLTTFVSISKHFNMVLKFFLILAEF